MRKLNTEEFIRRSKLVHGDKYDYSESIYEDARKPIAIRCKTHGLFFSTPDNHINKGSGCPYCAGNLKKYSNESFIMEARKIYGDRFTYEKANYINNHSDVNITCPIHGSFYINPISFLMGMDNPCPKCDLYREVDTEKFIIKSREIHGNIYDYSKVVYIGNRVPVIITCPIHGDFLQLPHEHLIGHGCQQCNNGVLLDTDEFIHRAKLVHGDRYLYNNTKYINSVTNVIITCPIHGDFLQRPANHLNGRGCPYCNRSQLERNLIMYMKSKNIVFVEQATWDWLVYKGRQTVDFYIPNLNIAIECQGIQHFLPVPFFESELDNFETRTKRDENKQFLCLSHGIPIYYLSNLSKTNNPFKYPYLVFEDPEELFEYATNNNIRL